MLVAVFGKRFGYFTRMMSSYVIAPRLLKQYDNVLNAALDNDARKRLESLGTFENKSDIDNGISSLVVLILHEKIGSHSIYE